MIVRISPAFWALSLLLFVRLGAPITCEIGHGQRGKRFSSQVSWQRYCPLTNYCFEAVTSDVKKMRKLIDFPWDEYYDQYFVRSCGGDLGTPLDFHPWRGKPKSFRSKLGSVKVNITTPSVLTGQGGTQELDLRYTCRHDLCSAAYRHVRIPSLCALVIVAVSLLTAVW